MKSDLFWPKAPTGKHGNLSHFRPRAVAHLTILALCAAVPAGAATFYLDSVAGSDANTSGQAQSPSTPWRCMPGMSGVTGNAASYNVQPGDVFVLKGGSAWTFTSTTDNLLTIPAPGITIQGGQQLATPWGSGYPVLDGTGSMAYPGWQFSRLTTPPSCWTVSR